MSALHVHSSLTRKLLTTFMSYGNKLSCRFCGRQTNNFFITTPIFYVNAAPHIGHVYTTVLSDAFSRWHRLKGHEVLFTTGTDEHGQKIQQSALKAKKFPEQYTAEHSKLFHEILQVAGVDADDFIQTTEKRHFNAVQHFWRKLSENGFIYKDFYKGWYSLSDETFIVENNVKEVQDKTGKLVQICSETGNPVIWIEEENYMFQLSQFIPQLREWLNSNVIQPPLWNGLAKSYLPTLSDLSISRSRERISWGIPVPGDDTQTVYVWLDALVNYLTVTGYPEKQNQWPPSCHVVGKEILKFHALFWPAFLMAAGMELPNKILCHSHWLVDGQKMSKSKGNVINPVDLMEKYSPDCLRYFLLREGVPHSDNNFNEQKMVECVNSEIVNTFGNLLSRCTSKIVNPDQIFPSLEKEAFYLYFNNEERHNYDKLQDLSGEVDEAYAAVNIYKSLEKISAALRSANSLLEKHKPWELVKQDNQQKHLQTLLHVAMETLRISSILLLPVIPNLSHKVLNRLGVSPSQRLWCHAAPCPFIDLAQQNLGNDTSVLLKRIKQ